MNREVLVHLTNIESPGLEVWSFCGSLMIPVTTLCIVIFAERQAQILLAKPNLLPERKSLNVKVLFIIIKHKKNVY